MSRKSGRCQTGFTLLEILIVLAIIGIFWGVGMSVTPRLLSSSGPGSLARHLAGVGQEARQMALLQQRPWELLFDLDQGVFYRSPLGSVRKRELRDAGTIDGGFLDPANQGEDDPVSPGAQSGKLNEQDLVLLRQRELELQPKDMLRVIRRYDRLAYNYDDAIGDIVESPIPEEVGILQIWQDGHAETEGRVSLVFGPRGYILPTAVWLEDADSPGKDIHTVYFSGIVPPEVAGGMLLPDDRGILMPVEEP